MTRSRLNLTDATLDTTIREIALETGKNAMEIMEIISKLQQDAHGSG
jgi:hypothetical protein